MDNVNLTVLMSHVRAVLNAWADNLSDERNQEVMDDLKRGGVLSLEVMTNPPPFDWFQAGIRVYLHLPDRQRQMLAHFSVDHIN